MTKIFEALEYAGLDRTNLRGQEETSPPVPRQPEINQVLFPATALKPTDGSAANFAAGLYQNMIALLPGREGRIIQFQGTQKGDGTTTLVRKLAILAAMKLQKKVLLLDLNQNTPNQCSYFHVRSELPLSDSTLRAKPARKDFARVDDSSLYVTQLSARHLSDNIVCEMSQIGDLLKELRGEFDLILIDSPAVISCPEWLLLAPKVDGVVLVVEAGKTRWQTVNKVKESISAQNGNILGVVLNKRRYPIPDFIYKRI